MPRLTGWMVFPIMLLAPVIGLTVLAIALPEWPDIAGIPSVFWAPLSAMAPGAVALWLWRGGAFVRSVAIVAYVILGAPIAFYGWMAMDCSQSMSCRA